MLSSDSDMSDLEILFDLSDWDESEIDTTDDENEPVRVYKERVNYIKTLDAHEFVLRFRVSKTLVESLLTEIYPHLNDLGSRNVDMSPLHQLLLTLRFYALGSLVSVGQFIGVSKSLANQIVRDVSCAITHLYSKYVCVNNTTDKFYKIARFPHVLGVIDCTHIKIHITRVRRITEDYRNNTGSYSINVQAVCDANLMFMNIESKWPGSTDDATIFLNSVLKVQCERKVYGNKWLLGDNAYPLKPYLLTPILNPQSRSEELYNQSHNTTRDCIVQCFKLWKRRFPALGFIIRTSVISANAVILATAILHNICITSNVDDVPPEVKIPYEEVVPVSDVLDVPKNAELEALLANHFNEEM
ncbi:putative nuclease HARBI1 [Bicyclus anynana]|uniref:Nuclease HARBI1 n=1 Tax=Bicyclus anynana TaxID=110368 RepID=A0A6J1NDA8_BICAN|nr:putative nuclease HARBI1 [Bicyclus anynana]